VPVAAVTVFVVIVVVAGVVAAAAVTSRTKQSVLTYYSILSVHALSIARP
jgi:hypothetical protein